MQDTDLYRHLLGVVEPWLADRVKLSVTDERVDVWVAHPKATSWPCPDCQASCPTYDHAEQRSWRHLDSCQFKTFLHARPPRIRCAEHGVRQVALPWAEAHSRFTSLFERLAIDVLKATDVTGATRILRISWDQAFAIMVRAVTRGLAARGDTAPVRIGVDEKAAAKGHKYLTLVTDLDAGTVVHVAQDRTTESLDDYLKTLTDAQRAAIQAVAMDMWQPYVASARTWLPDADDKIVYDRFRIMGHLGKAVDTVRKREHKALRLTGDDTLVGSKYLWLYAGENLPERHHERFAQLRSADLKTARAWAIKEDLRWLWDYRRRGWAARHWKAWYFWATHSRLQPIIAAAKTIHRHLSGVLNFFGQRVTNAVSEGLNSKIQTIKKRAYGFRNREHFKTAIYFHCGGLNLYPATHGILG